MSEPFLAEIRIFGFNFAPRGFAFCDGQVLPISQNQALFSLLGTTYGGDDRATFALPDLRGRTPNHAASGVPLGTRAGAESHPLTEPEMPSHYHMWRAHSGDGTAPVPAGQVLAAFNDGYGPPANLIEPAIGTIAAAGGSQPHDNMQPGLALSFCIALQGLFPSRN